MKALPILAAVLAAIPSLGANSQKLSYTDLTRRLTDLEALALLPAPGDRCAQWSSYDRASRYDKATGKYLAWEANGDGHGIIRREGNQEVLAEMKGPGCLWRIWSAAPKSGHVRIYLDDAPEPEVDLPFSGYFDRKNAPFTRPALVHTVARGCNNYTPIPYQKSCRITADADWGEYYQFVFETFPTGTQVPTFKRNLSPNDAGALDKADRLLAACGPAETEPTGATVTGEGLLDDKGEISARFEGPAAIRCLRIKPELPPSPEDYNVLRATWIQIRWDGEAEPSVWAPLGDFFGSAPGANSYRSLPLGLSRDGWWYCNWVMPFAKSAEVLIKNEGGTPLKMKCQIHTKPLAGDMGRFGRFHAKWHRDALPPAEPERAIDWTVLKTQGAGRFVGMMLHVWNPRGGWWGEGDEKFFVDDEKFPSTFGTGSEDYFGYAWCDPTPFQHAYHNQTHNEGNNRGHVSVNRWHIADSIPFQNSFEGCIEKYFPNQRPTLYAAMSYWYLAPGGRDPYPVVPLKERIGYWLPVQAYKVTGAIEGEHLQVLGRSGGETQEQDMTGFTGQWSNDAQLWWTGARPGAKLDLGLPVSKRGSYAIELAFTKAPDYAIVQLSLDGQPLGAPVDLYAPSVTAAPFLAGNHEFTAGTHKLTMEITGANAKAVRSYMVGLDYLKLSPAAKTD
jgi:hypothetical protein